MKKMMMGVVSMLLVLALFCPLSVSASASMMRQGGGEAPLTFTLESARGKTVSLETVKGKGAILFFFTTWCPMCIKKIPSLSADYETFQKEGVDFFAIDVGESQAKVASFAARQNIPFDILLDKDMKMADAYDVIGVPTFVVISKSGRVAYAGNSMADNYRELLNQ